MALLHAPWGVYLWICGGGAVTVMKLWDQRKVALLHAPQVCILVDPWGCSCNRDEAMGPERSGPVAHSMGVYISGSMEV